MSKSSDDVSVKDLVDPLMIIAKSKDTKETVNVIKFDSEELNRLFQTDVKLINYYKFFSEINSIGSRFTGLSDDLDGFRFDGLIELGKTNALISTGILKTVLEIKELLSSFSSINHSKVKDNFTFDDALSRASGLIGIASVFLSKGALKRFGVGAVLASSGEYIASNAESGSGDKILGENLSALGTLITVASVLSKIPNPYAKLAAGTIFTLSTAERVNTRDHVDSLTFPEGKALAPGVPDTPENREKFAKIISRLNESRNPKWIEFWKDVENRKQAALHKQDLYRERLREQDAEWQNERNERRERRNDDLAYAKHMRQKKFDSILSMFPVTKHKLNSQEKVELGKPSTHLFYNLNRLKDSDPINDFLNSLSNFSDGCFDPSSSVPHYEFSSPNYHSTNTFHNTFVLPQGTTLEQAKEVNSHLLQQREITQELNGGAS